ncbi:type IV pilus modification PilV family protein [Lyngbya confervoides]|uniref:Prepilin-type N-terminal cleavage/methylation domain-containing protein n=1 Tax=Lyngbya confervoides BDU141951 TaxID=1574623 RepID=A0ABD4SXZ4_9CYAN|nr:prepilin-type N-terminal cleavage/methylation domain-containing protein [Lyngbya confervoides]MCM1981290.1 prepilin-type N-terminal cleavage/methylation domain-containing protein [Lyngbya confervoides BDU141951]
MKEPIQTTRSQLLPARIKGLARSFRQGFSLVEAMVSLLVLFAVMGGLIPVFMTWRINTVNNTIKTGAIAISQQILDELRQDPNVDAWASSGTVTVMPSGKSIAPISYNSKTYNASITYCATAGYCNARTRHVKLEVSHNAKPIYIIETVFTKFE